MYSLWLAMSSSSLEGTSCKIIFGACTISQRMQAPGGADSEAIENEGPSEKSLFGTKQYRAAKSRRTQKTLPFGYPKLKTRRSDWIRGLGSRNIMARKALPPSQGSSVVFSGSDEIGGHPVHPISGQSSGSVPASWHPGVFPMCR